MNILKKPNFNKKYNSETLHFVFLLKAQVLNATIFVKLDDNLRNMVKMLLTKLASAISNKFKVKRRLILKITVKNQKFTTFLTKAPTFCCNFVLV